MMRELTVITLKCAGCGAGLSISEDMTRFACGYCGTEQIVERKGGTVALKPITDAIGRVQVGTDKTAAELALARLPQELNDLTRQRDSRSAFWEKEIARRRDIASGRVHLVGIISLVALPMVIVTFAQLIAPPFGTVLGLIIGVTTSGFLMFKTHRHASITRDADIEAMGKDQERDLVAFDTRIREMKEKIEENRRIANS